ncbi:MAG: hypothetical protein RBS80_31780 [Thermoguttaceae bacterium]|jgi:hypothetical protein|nr:hypothetical protein [Thermoguttaceae bacterium]
MGTERLQEIAAATGCRVDRQNGVIRGVKIIGRVSRNGREYTARALQDAAGLYEGVKVNVNHAELGQGRRYEDRIGCLRSVRSKDDGLYADFHFNQGHALAEQLAWDAENAPGNVGLSHDAEGRTVRRDGKTVVEAVLSVRSVDLVADPATTTGLYEGMADNAGTSNAFPDHTAFVDSIRGESVDSAALTRFADAIRE